MSQARKLEALAYLKAAHEFEGNRIFLPPEMYDYFAAVLELSHTPARLA